GNPLGAVVRSIPTALQGVMKPLFQWYIPNLKYSLFLRLMSEQAAEHAADLKSGAMTRTQLARKVVDSVENRFGELNFDNLFWNRTFKTAMQFAFRSVTWKLGNVRELGGGICGQAKEFGRWAWQAHELLGGAPREVSVKSGLLAKPMKIPFPEPGMAKPGVLPKLDMKASWNVSLILLTAGLGSIAAKALSGKYPWDWADAEHRDDGSGARAKAMYLETVHPRTGETDSHGKPVRISLPTYWKDVEHAISNPAQYVLGSLSTTLGKSLDLAHNEDYFGNYIYNPNAGLGTKLKQSGKYVFPTPFVLSNYQRNLKSAGKKTAALSAFGFPKAPSNLDYTPAERMAADLLKVREARHTPEEIEAWQAKHEALKAGELGRKEMHRYLRDQRHTWLERDFRRLTFPEALKVYNVASEEEKGTLDPLMRRKSRNYREAHGRKAWAEAEKEALQ
ncbi:MAG: hypothetical protein LAO22_24175, partial [Acidobacteriia bacterium]|nr:hypothetical protein [Terriglobia bacterium]